MVRLRVLFGLILAFRSVVLRATRDPASITVTRGEAMTPDLHISLIVLQNKLRNTL